MLDFLDAFDQTSINGLLDVFQFSAPFSISFISSLNILLSGFRSILELVLGVPSRFFEERVVNVGFDAIDGHLGGGGNDVSRVDSSEGDSVDGVGASD